MEWFLAMPVKSLGFVSQNPSDSKSNQLNIDMILPVLLYSVEVYSRDSSNIIGNSPEVSNFNWLFLKLNRFICN